MKVGQVLGGHGSHDQTDGGNVDQTDGGNVDHGGDDCSDQAPVVRIGVGHGAELRVG